MLADQGYDGKKADVWSMGVILYVLLAGFLPFDEKTIVDLFQKIQNADYTFPSWFSRELMEIISLILVSDPRQRISSSDLKAHPHLAYLFKHSEPPASAGGKRPGSEQAHAGSRTSAYETATTELAQNLQKLTVEAQNSSGPDTQDVEDEVNDKRWSTVNGADDDIVPMKPLNVFDLINKCGGFGMDQIFNPQLLFAKSLQDSAGAPSSAKKPGVPTSIREGPGPHQNPYKPDANSVSFTMGSTRHGHYNFSSGVAPASALVESIYSVLKKQGWDMTITLADSKLSGLIRATKMTPKGMIGIGINVCILCPSLSLVQVIRGKGDRLEWSTVFNELVDVHLAKLINNPAGLKK